MKKKMATVQSDLLRKFTDIAFDESAEVRWRESERLEADDLGANSMEGDNTQIYLFESAINPF